MTRSALGTAPLASAQTAWIQTFTGERFELLDPRPEQVHIEDIAHALAKLDRYCGHLPMHYSVAQHSLLLSEHCSPPLALTGLLHDATEAYVGDLLTPIKRLLPDYAAIEHRIWEAVAIRYGLPRQQPEEIKILDRRLLVTEVQQLMRTPLPDWEEKFEQPPLPIRLQPLDWETARRRFLARFEELSGEAPVGG